jgi:hypothetical protein
MQLQEDLNQPREGTMPDKRTPLILAGLARAATAELPLHGTRTTAGLFPTSAAGKAAAQQCCADGYLTAVPAKQPATVGGDTATATRKKTSAVLYTITDTGIEFLLASVSPRKALEDFHAALKSRHGEIAELCDLTRQTLTATESLATSVKKVLDKFGGPTSLPGGQLKAMLREFLAEPKDTEGPGSVETGLLQELERWQQADACEDYPLPNLYRHAAGHTSGLTIGAFHDVLRRLHESGKVYLHPWSGPLYELPEPPYALLVGHEIAYYASLKQD